MGRTHVFDRCRWELSAGFRRGVSLRAATLLPLLTLASVAHAEPETFLPPGAPFSLGEHYVQEGPGSRFATGDWDRDGDIDLVSSRGGAGLGILWNDGTGRFDQGSVIPGSDGAYGAATADLDADGILDLAASVSMPHAGVLILRGNGDGTFGSPVLLPVATPVGRPRIGDLNRDGRPDMVVNITDGLALFLNGPDGFASPAVYPPASDCPTGIDIGDLDRDGWPDVAVAQGCQPSVGLYRNLGSGVLAPPVEHAVGSISEDLRVADLDADGAGDLAVATESGLCLLWGDHLGGFSAPDVHWVRGYSCTALEISDLDADGRIDVLMGERYDLLGRWVTLAIQRQARRFDTNPACYIVSDAWSLEPVAIVLADVDGEHGEDLLTLSRSTNYEVSTLSVLRRIGPLAFAAPMEVSLFESASFPPIPRLRLQAVDFAGRGSHDLLVETEGRNWLLRCEPGGAAEPQALELAGTFWSIDLNRDGRTDLLGRSSDTITVVLAASGGSLLQEERLIGGGLVTTGDFTGDGYPDLLVQTPLDSLDILVNDGSGRFPARLATGLADHEPLWHPVAGRWDLDGDGLADLVLRHVPEERTTPGDTIAVFYNDGHGRMVAGGTYAVGDESAIEHHSTRLLGVESVDLNGDGVDDVACRTLVDSDWLDLTALEGRRDRTLGPAADYRLPRESPDVLLADLDMDGLPDLVSLSHGGVGDGRFHFQLNRQGTFEPEGRLDYTYIQNYPGSPVQGDFNADGKPDLAYSYHVWERYDGVVILYNVLETVPTPTLIDLADLRVEARSVRLEWFVSGGEGRAASVWRVGEGEAWRPLGNATAAGRGRYALVDDSVVPGRSYDYRLELGEGPSAVRSAEVHVEVPTLAGHRLAIDGVTPNPAGSNVVVSFSLASSATASIEVLDVAGRRLRMRRLGQAGAGSHRLELPEASRLPIGVYWVRVIQDGRAAVAKLAVLR